MKKSLFTVYVFFKINTRRFFRDKLALFFSIGFPLIFLFVFGGLNSGNSGASFKVAVINQSTTQYAKNFVDHAGDGGVLKVNSDITDLDEAKEKMTRSEIDAAIVLPEDFGEVKPGMTVPSGEAKVIYTQNNQQSAQALKSVLALQFGVINSQLVKTETPFTVASEQLNERSLSAFDYAFAGLVGFAIIGMGIFGPINVFPELKKMGILRRLSTTPLRVWQYFLSVMAEIGRAHV